MTIRSPLTFLCHIKRGVEKFDPTKGYRFSTYAYWWIRQAMTRAIANTSRSVRLPVHVYDKYFKIRKAERNLSQRLGKTPRLSEVAEEARLTVDELRDVLLKTSNIASLNLPIGEKKKQEFADLLEGSTSVELSVERILLSDDLNKALDVLLTPRQKQIILYRFGLYDGRGWTRDEIGLVLNLSRERIRQIENKALKILRVNKSSFAGLRDYLH